MKWVVLLVLAACGGSTKNTKVEEVPIEQGGGGGSGTLPPDEVGDSGVTTSTTAIPSGTAPPGVGPQSLDVQQDAGSAQSTSATPHFVQRTGGLTERECTDMVMGFAKIMSKENKSTAPSATDLPKDPIYGQMLADCGQQTTKKQKTCATATRTSAAWKKCME